MNSPESQMVVSIPRKGKGRLARAEAGISPSILRLPDREGELHGLVQALHRVEDELAPDGLGDLLQVHLVSGPGG